MMYYPDMIVKREIEQASKPFLKWAGGKRWLAPFLAELLRNERGRHVEPFVGSGACFFHSPQTNAILSDINAELINTYKVVRDDPTALLQQLSRLPINKATFDRFRKGMPSSNLAKATRFIYLNRTAFNGLYRVNRKGEFNVPYGCKASTKLPESKLIRRCATKLKNASLHAKSFQNVLSSVQKNDRVYLDPPYTVKHNNNAFRRYNEKLFSWEDQKQLAKSARLLAKRNILVVISNALHRDVIKLYRGDSFYMFCVSRQTNMSASADCRGVCKELLLVSKTTHHNDLSIRILIRKHLCSGSYGITL